MVRIRVYPQGWFSGGVRRRRPAALYNMQLQAERQRANMRLQYERMLWSQQLRIAQLQGRYGAGVMHGVAGAYTTGVIAPPTLVNPWLLNAMVAARLGADVFGSSNQFWGSVGSLV
jgi:hypothetical protein